MSPAANGIANGAANGLDDTLSCKPPAPEKLRVIGLLGSGTFASVWRVDGGSGGREFALKRCEKRLAAVEKRGIENLLEEKRVHDMLHHSMIVRLFYTFQDAENCCFLLELCEGGDLGMLLDYTDKQPESSARFYAGCVVLALRHLHSNSWIQRDLKPDNVLLDARGFAKLADFGYSAYLERPEARKFTMCGTDEYVAPEMLRNQGRSFPSDWWALGVLIHHLLLGRTPFAAEDEDEAFDYIMEYAHGDPRKRQAAQDQLRADMLGEQATAEVCDVTIALLNPSERKRLGSGPAYEGPSLEEFPWFAGAPGWDWGALENQQMTPPPRPWEAANARNCHGEYRSAPISAERAVQKWGEVSKHAAPVDPRDQRLFEPFGETVVLAGPDPAAWSARNELHERISGPQAE